MCPLTDNSYWDVITTGFTVVGDYTHGNTYKTGEVVRYGGNTYVVKQIILINISAVQEISGATNTSYWELIGKGFSYKDTYSSSTSYKIGEVVRYVSSSYVQLKDRQTNVTLGTDGTVWQLIGQGDTGVA